MSELICRHSGKRYPADQPIWCGEDGCLLDLAYEPSFDRSSVRSEVQTLWRYRRAIPIEDDANVLTLGEGYTPLLRFAVGGRKILLKLDHLSPTGSYKDRGAAVMVSKAKELEIRRVVEDSSGNAGSAIAAYCAAASIACDIYVPATCSPAKRRQIEAYGATIHAIPGTREDTARAALEAARSAYYASHVWNPYFFQGTKTFAYEVAEQLGWRSPDVVVIPTGNGTLLIGAFVGFSELRDAGVIDRLPRLIAVQATGFAPLYHAWAGTKEPEARRASGEAPLADGIAIAEPARAEQCLEAVRVTDGSIVRVGDDETLAAWREAQRMGFLIEPTSATALAAFRNSDWEGEVVISITGHGLKSTTLHAGG